MAEVGGTAEWDFVSVVSCVFVVKLLRLPNGFEGGNHEHTLKNTKKTFNRFSINLLLDVFYHRDLGAVVHLLEVYFVHQRAYQP